MPKRKIQTLYQMRRVARNHVTNTASHKQFRRWPVPGDGDCMYTALWCGLHQRFDQTMSNVAKQGALEIRRDLSTILQEHVWSNRFNHQFGYNEARNDLANELNLSRNTNIEALRNAYYAGVGNYLYGDDLTRGLFELVWDVDVVVYEQATDDAQVIIRQTPNIIAPKPLTIYLLNVNSYSSVDAHFDLLQPL